MRRRRPPCLRHRVRMAVDRMIRDGLGRDAILAAMLPGLSPQEREQNPIAVELANEAVRRACRGAGRPWRKRS